MRRRLHALGQRRLNSTRAYLTLPPELSVILAPGRLILEHAQPGRVVSLYLEVEIDDSEAASSFNQDLV